MVKSKSFIGLQVTRMQLPILHQLLRNAVVSLRTNWTEVQVQKEKTKTQVIKTGSAKLVPPTHPKPNVLDNPIQL